MSFSEMRILQSKSRTDLTNDIIMKKQVTTDKAPAAIGPYSQAVISGSIVYISGQIPLNPSSGELVGEDISAQIEQTFTNFATVVEAAGGSLQQVVKLTIYLTDLSHFAQVNEKMKSLFPLPYPARAVIQAAALPKGVQLEMDGIMDLA